MAIALLEESIKSLSKEENISEDKSRSIIEELLEQSCNSSFYAEYVVIC